MGRVAGGIPSAARRLGAASLLSLALSGCSGPAASDTPPDASAGGSSVADSGAADAGALAACDPGVGETRTFVVSGLEYPSSNAVGFDLDSHTTAGPRDRIGCGVPDPSSGVDNMLPVFTEAVASAAHPNPFPCPCEALYHAQHTARDAQLTLTIQGYSGDADDACVEVSLADGDEIVSAGALGSVEDGRLRVALPSVPADIVLWPGEEQEAYEWIRVNLRRASIDAPLDGGLGTLGGVALWEDEMSVSLARAFEALNAPDFFGDPLLEFLDDSIHDIGTGTPETCGEMSVGMGLRLREATVPQ